MSYTVECDRCHVTISKEDEEFRSKWAEITDNFNNIQVPSEKGKQLHLCGECTNKFNAFVEKKNPT